MDSGIKICFIGPQLSHLLDTTVASLEHNRHIFGTQRSHPRITTVTTRVHTRQITAAADNNFLSQAEIKEIITFFTDYRNNKHYITGNIVIGQPTKTLSTNNIKTVYIS